MPSRSETRAVAGWVERVLGDSLTWSQRLIAAGFHSAVLHGERGWGGKAEYQKYAKSTLGEEAVQKLKESHNQMSSHPLGHVDD